MSGYPHPPPGQGYGSAPYGAPPPQGYATPYGESGYSPFSMLVPSAFPPGTDPNVVACFRIADQDGSGLIDDEELQRALSSYNQSFSLRTVHLLMYHFTNSNTRKIGPKEFTSLFYGLQSWRDIFERFDRDRSGKIDSSELRDALLSLGFAVLPAVLDLLVSKFDKTGGESRAIEYDNFIECCLTVKLLHDIKSVGREERGLGIINPGKIQFGSIKYYRYIGSLTTRPCTEGVIWIIIKKLGTVSREQVEALREAVNDGFEANARPTQNSDGIDVELYNPKENGGSP